MKIPSEGTVGDEVRLWHAASSSGEPGLLERRCADWLDGVERTDANRFRVATSRNQHIVGRGMARKLLSAEAVAPTTIQFAFEPQGKPYVVAPPVAAQRPFNVAHTDGLVVCGIGATSHAMIGVDVERLSRRTNPELAERYFSQPEIAYLQAQSEQARRETFLRIWTLKESFIKAIGTGLQTPLCDFAFTQIDSPTPRIELLHPDLDSDHHWTFHCLQPRPGFVAAVAVATRHQDDHRELQVQSLSLPVQSLPVQSLQVQSFDDLL